MYSRPPTSWANRCRPEISFGNLVNADLVIVCRFLEVGGFHQLQDFLRAHFRQQIVDSFSLCDVPGDERDFRAAGSQFSRQEASGDFHLFVFFRIRVKGDDHAATFPD